MGSDEPVVENSDVKKLECRLLELERMLDHKTMAIAFPTRAKKSVIAADRVAEGWLPMKTVAGTLGYLTLEPYRAVERQNKATRSQSQG